MNAISNLIGREKEVKELQALYRSGKSEFVAIYGRRRSSYPCHSGPGKSQVPHGPAASAAGDFPADHGSAKIREMRMLYPDHEQK